MAARNRRRRIYMKALVAYFSQTGNTKKVAEVVFDELPYDKELKDIAEVSDLEGYDLVFIGFPVVAFGAAPPAKEFLESHAEGRKVALFVTHAAPEEEAAQEGWLQNCRDAACKAQVVDFFDCQGELAEPVAEALLKSGNPMFEEFGKRQPETKGQPDESRLQRAREWAREAASKF
jgi:flavodoxin